MNGQRVPLNRLAFGLLDFFGIKNQGRYTQHLLEDLQPVLDLDRLYKIGAERLVIGHINGVTSSGSIFVSSSPVDLFVPESQVWHVHAFSTIITIPTSGDGIALTLATRQEQGSYLTPGEALTTDQFVYTSSAVNTTSVLGIDWQGHGRYFGPRTRFGLSGRVGSATGVNFSFQLRYTPMAF